MALAMWLVTVAPDVQVSLYSCYHQAVSFQSWRATHLVSSKALVNLKLRALIFVSKNLDQHDRLLFSVFEALWPAAGVVAAWHSKVINFDCQLSRINSEVHFEVSVEEFLEMMT